jgi:hypothetical protein
VSSRQLFPELNGTNISLSEMKFLVEYNRLARKIEATNKRKLTMSIKLNKKSNRVRDNFLVEHPEANCDITLDEIKNIIRYKKMSQKLESSKRRKQNYIKFMNGKSK